MEREPTRRRLLGAAGLALGLGTAGCSGEAFPGGGSIGRSADGAETTRTAEPTTRTPTDTPTPEPTPEPTPTSEPTGTPTDGPVSVSLDPVDGVLTDVPLPENPEQRPYPVMGADDAPVSVTFYGGWKCRFTRKFVTGYLHTLVEEFVLPGNLQLEFQAVAYDDGEPFHGPDEPRVARFGYAVWHSDPDSFFRYMSTMFENQHTGAGWYTTDRLVAIADELDVSSEKFLRTATKAQQYDTAVQETMERVEEIPIAAIPRLHLASEAVPGDGNATSGAPGEEPLPPTATGGGTDGVVLVPNLEPEVTASYLRAAVDAA